MIYDKKIWYTTSDRTLLVKRDVSIGSSSVFKREVTSRVTKGTVTHTATNKLVQVDPLEHLASVLSCSGNSFEIHSTSRVPTFTDNWQHKTIKSILMSLPNNELWKTLNLDGDGEWLVDSLARGTLVIIHDGFFMDIWIKNPVLLVG